MIKDIYRVRIRTSSQTDQTDSPTYIGRLRRRLVGLLGEGLLLFNVPVPTAPLHPLLLRRLLGRGQRQRGEIDASET